MNKRKCQQKHAKKRARERFGLNLSNAGEKEIISKIQRNRAKFIRRDSNRISIFDVEYQGQILRIVYDSERKSIASILTTEMN